MRTMDLLMDTQMLLDEASCLLRDFRARDAFRVLHAPLAEFRDAALRHGIYRRFVRTVRGHDIKSLTMEDPLTHRAFSKPRGYPGDAVTIDLIYKGEVPKGTSETGRHIFPMTSRSPGALSVVFRRGLFRSYIDDTVVRRNDCRILSVASGHCRELDGSLILTGDCEGRFIAVDQDQWTCNHVAREYEHKAVRVVPIRIVNLLENRHRFGQFDLIYSASLFDYVSSAVARRLVKHLMRMLRPGGRLVVGNFTPECPSRGYMDTLMDWPLVYRNTDELTSLFAGHGDSPVRTFVDPHGNVGYAEARRAE